MTNVNFAVNPVVKLIWNYILVVEPVLIKALKQFSVYV